jgi:hypothetical protein
LSRAADVGGELLSPDRPRSTHFESLVGQCYRDKATHIIFSSRWWAVLGSLASRARGSTSWVFAPIESENCRSRWSNHTCRLITSQGTKIILLISLPGSTSTPKPSESSPRPPRTSSGPARPAPAPAPARPSSPRTRKSSSGTSRRASSSAGGKTSGARRK